MANTKFWGLLRTFVDGVTLYTGEQIARLHSIASTQTTGALFAAGEGVIRLPDSTSLQISAGAGLSVNMAIGMCSARHSTIGPSLLWNTAIKNLAALPASRGAGAPIYIHYGIEQTSGNDSLTDAVGVLTYSDNDTIDGAQLLAAVTTSASAVLTVTDRRKFIDQITADKVTDFATAVQAASQSGRTVTQNAHGLAVGNFIRSTGTNTYGKAQADAVANAHVIGYVTAVQDANTFTFVTPGRVISGLSGLTAPNMYYLDPTTAGAVAATAPTALGQVRKVVLVAINATEAVFLNHVGTLIGLVRVTAIATGNVAASTDVHQVNATGNTTHTMPAGPPTNGTNEITVKSINTGVVTITAPGGFTMEGGVDKTISTQFNALTFYLDGTVWRVK